jgi:hypothetical protein
VRCRDVVLCDNEACGAILRLGGATAISMQLEHDALGTFFYCPRCGLRTGVQLSSAERGSIGGRWAPVQSRPPSNLGRGVATFRGAPTRPRAMTEIDELMHAEDVLQRGFLELYAQRARLQLPSRQRARCTAPARASARRGLACVLFDCVDRQFHRLVRGQSLGRTFATPHFHHAALATDSERRLAPDC